MNYTTFFASALGLMSAMLPTTALAQGLNVSAIAVVNNASVLDCWNLAAPATFARGVANFPMGDSTGNFLGVIPPNTHIGQAWAPYIQYSIFLSGLTRVSMPSNTSAVAFFQAGDILMATDLRNVSAAGHITDFPGAENTVIAQLPIDDNVVPEHTVVHSGRCTKEDLAASS